MAARTVEQVEAFAREYDSAWRRKDLDAIVARHSADGTFHSHTAGAPPVRGRDAIRAAFAGSLGNWAELDFSVTRVRCAPGFYVWEATLSGILAHPLELGALTIPVTGERVAFAGVDVITLDDDGLIGTKDSYFDLIAAANQSSAK